MDKPVGQVHVSEDYYPYVLWSEEINPVELDQQHLYTASQEEKKMSDYIPKFENDMDLRDYFAAKSLPLAMEWVKHNYDREVGSAWLWNEEEFEDDPKEIADVAYKIADAMMKARSK